MDYPLLLNGEEAGILHVERQGLYTCMEARSVFREGLRRIWVQGGGQEAYLGLLQPAEGGLYLRRRMSRQEMRAFPQVIQQASDRRLPPQEEVDIIHKTQKPPQTLTLPLPDLEHGPEVPNLEPTPEEQAQPLPGPEPRPEAQPAGPVEPSMLLWQQRRDGSLVAKEGGHILLALPARLRRVPPGAHLRQIGGRDYLVFRY